MLRPQGHREELVKALPRELVKAPLQGPIWYLVLLSDSEEGLNRRGTRDLDMTATRRQPDGSIRWKHGQSSRQRKYRPASRPYGIKGDLQEGLNRRSARNLIYIYKATHRRVSIGVIHTT